MKWVRAQASGFTLLEIMIVIAIIGILVAVGLTSFVSSQKKSRDIKRKNDLRQVSLALESYYNDKNRYPASSANGQIAGCFPDDATICDWNTIFQDKNNTVYMVKLPIESDSGGKYVYVAGVNGISYQLYARLENTDDSAIPKNAQGKSRVFSDIACGAAGVYCNWGISSPNTAVETGRTITYQ